MSTAGTHVERVDVPADLEDFNKSTWSHDGTRLLHSNAFVFDDDGELVAFRPAISAPDGSDYRLLGMPNRPMDMYCSAWSPDDSRILCKHAGGIISFRSSDGGGARRLTTNPYGGQDLPDRVLTGRQPAAWVREGPRSTDEARAPRAIFVADTDGTHARRLNPLGTAERPRVRGGQLVPGRFGICRGHPQRPAGDRGRCRRRGHPVRPVDLGVDGFAVMPHYSPVGLRIVFAMFRDRPSDLFVVNVDGSGLTRITEPPTAPRCPPTGASAWSRRSRQAPPPMSRDPLTTHRASRRSLRDLLDQPKLSDRGRARGRPRRASSSCSGFSTTSVSVVSSMPAIEVALTSAERVTLTGSRMPWASRSPYSPVAAL